MNCKAGQTDRKSDAFVEKNLVKKQFFSRFHEFYSKQSTKDSVNFFSNIYYLLY